ncbi:hypothetical protein HY571_02170 [Candidatus Micrarchaeota archaeon]|nr:hypothetical protein [Candidatus Micrarchaeota archaeon]
MNFEELPGRAKELVSDIVSNHRLNKREKLRNRLEQCREIKDNLKHKYCELMELLRDSKPQGVTHFRLSRSGDVVFINNSQLFGKSFKRLTRLHLPLC